MTNEKMEKNILPKTFLYDRDENGELIPKSVPLENLVNGKKYYVKVTPLTRGERKKIAQIGLDKDGNTTRDTDLDLVLKHCHEPKFTEEDIDNAPLGFIENISITIIRESSIKIEKESDIIKASQKVDTDFQDAS